MKFLTSELFIYVQKSCQSMSKNNNSCLKAMAKVKASTTWINFQYSIMFTSIK